MRFIGQIRQEINQNQPAVQGWRLSLGLLLAALTAVPASTAFAATSAGNSPESLKGVPRSTMASSAGIEKTTEQSPSTPVQLVNSPLIPVLNYSRKSDYELTRMGARWDQLSVPEKQALLKEVKLRMAQRKDADGVLMIRTQHRYGRVYRGNGRYLKIETKVVRVRPAESAPRTSGFGVGYELRNSELEPNGQAVQQADDATTPSLDATAVTPPVVRVSEPSS